MPVYKYGESTIEATVEISATITLTGSTNPVNTHEPVPAALAIAMTTDLYGVGVSLQPMSGPVPNADNSIPQATDPQTFRVGYLVGMNALGHNETNEVWVGSVFLDYDSTGTASGTFTTSLIVSLPVDNCIEISNDGLYEVVDAPLGSTHCELFQRYSYTREASVSCGGIEVAGIFGGGRVGYVMGVGIAAQASGGAGGSWSVTAPAGFHAVSSSGTASDASGSGSATSPASLTLSANAGASVSGAVNAQIAPLKSFALAGVVRAMAAAYPDDLVGTCSKFAGDTGPDFPISGGAFSFSHDQVRGMFHGIYYGAGGAATLMGNVDINEWQGVQAKITSASLEAVGEDLPQTPDNYVVVDSESTEPPTIPPDAPRATRLLMRGTRFNAISLALPEDFLIDDCASLSPAGAWAGSWQAVGSGTAPALVSGGGVRFTGGAKRTFTHDVSLSSYRFLRLHLVNNADGAMPDLHVSIGGKTFKVSRVGTSDFYFVDLCAETGGPAFSLAGTKWPLRQRDYPITSDGLPRYEKSYAGVSRCQAMSITGPNDCDVTILRVELSRQAFYGETGPTATATFLPAFYRGKLIYQNGPTAPPTDLDKEWPTREFPTRYYGGGYTEPPASTDLWEDLTGGDDELTGYDAAQASLHGDGEEPDAPNKTNYWAWRFLLCNVSGRQGLEEKDSSYQVDETPEKKNLDAGETKIAEMVSRINAENSNGVKINPGWSAVDMKPPTGCTVTAPALPDFTNCYLSSERLAVWLFGGGAMAGGGGSWEYGFDKTIGTGATTFDAQMLFDSMDWFPGCGDFFGFGSAQTGSDAGGGTTGQLVLRAAAILRGAGQGLALTPARKPANAKTVELLQRPPTAFEAISTGAESTVSSGISGASGWYKLNALPFAKTVQPGRFHTGSVSASLLKLYGRKRKRAVIIIGNLVSHWIRGAASAAGRLARAYIVDDLLTFGFALSPLGTSWSEQATTQEAARPCVRYEPATGRLWVAYETSGGVSAAWTLTEGRDFGGMVTINGSGEYPAFFITAHGTHHYFWRTSAGAIEGKIMSGQGTQIYPASGSVLTVVSSGVADDAVSAWDEPATGRLFLTFHDTGGGIVTVVSSDGGKTYA